MIATSIQVATLCESISLSGQVWTKCLARPDTQGAPRGGCSHAPLSVLWVIGSSIFLFAACHFVYDPQVPIHCIDKRVGPVSAKVNVTSVGLSSELSYLKHAAFHVTANPLKCHRLSISLAFITGILWRKRHSHGHTVAVLESRTKWLPVILFILWLPVWPEASARSIRRLSLFIKPLRHNPKGGQTGIEVLSAWERL